MSKKSSSAKFLVVLLSAAFVALAVVVADLGVLAQNANSSTTQDDTTMQDHNMSTNTGRRGRRTRRGRARADRAANNNAEMMDANVSADDATTTGMQDDANVGMQGDANMSTHGTRRRGRRGRRGARATTDAGDTTQSAGMGANVADEQTDLSGSYTGTVHFPDAGIEGDATLEVNGNQFTLTSGGQTKTGRISAVTTRGYTGVAMMFSDGAASDAQATPISASARLIRTRNGFVLTNVPGARHILHGRFWTPGSETQMTPGTTRRGSGRRGRRTRRVRTTNQNMDDTTNPTPPR